MDVPLAHPFKKTVGALPLLFVLLGVWLIPLFIFALLPLILGYPKFQLTDGQLRIQSLIRIPESSLTSLMNFPAERMGKRYGFCDVEQQRVQFPMVQN